MVQSVSGKKGFLVRFKYEFNKDMSSNQLTAVIVERIPENKESEVPTISAIPDDQARCRCAITNFRA